MMDPYFGQYSRMGLFLGIFLPEFKLDKREFNKENADRLISVLVSVLDVLFKAENLSRRKNFRLPSGKTFFPEGILPVLDNVIAYLQSFNTQVLSMSKTERQTMVFILENIGDYLKNSLLREEEREKKNLFTESKFWIENLFKLFDQKISGAVAASKRVTPKNLFGPQEALHDELIYGNATLNFSLFPFAVIQEERVLFLLRPDENGALFRDCDNGDEKFLEMEGLWQKTAEFFLANFSFPQLDRIERFLPKDEAGFLGKWRQVESALSNQQLKLFAESQMQLEEIAFEDFNMPLIYLLQIRNLSELNRGLEMKRLLQKFLLFYPFYAQGHEMMGDIYAQEENYELALNFYEKDDK